MVRLFLSRNDSLVPYWQTKPLSTHLWQLGFFSSPGQAVSINQTITRSTVYVRRGMGSVLHLRLLTRHLRHPVRVLLRRVFCPDSGTPSLAMAYR